MNCLFIHCSSSVSSARQVSTYLWGAVCALVLSGGFPPLWFRFFTASASRVLQPCQVSWLGNTILEVIGVCTNLRFWFLTETSTLSRDLEGRKLPGGFPGVVEVSLAALCSSQAQSFVSDIWIATAGPPCIVYWPFWEGEKDRSVSVWPMTRLLLKVTFFTMNNWLITTETLQWRFSYNHVIYKL